MVNLINGTGSKPLQIYNTFPISAHVNRFVGPRKCRFHCRKQIQIMLALDDSFVICIEDTEYQLDKDDIFIVNANEFHDINKGDSTGKTSDVLIIDIPASLFDSYYHEIHTMKFVGRLIRSSDQSDSLHGRLLKNIVKLTTALHYREKGYELECMSYINSFFSLLIRFNHIEKIKGKEGDGAGNVNLERIERIVNMIHENFANNITLTAIAKEEGLDIYYLSHFIKKHLGISFRQYVNKLKLDKAVENMCRTDKKMIDICMESGYSDYRYFYKAFTEKYKCNPTRFRAKFGKGLLEERNFPVSDEEEENVVFMDEGQTFTRLQNYIVKINREYLLEA